MDHLAALVGASATPSAILFPPEWSRPERHSHINFCTPTDLVLALARLTI